MSFWFSGETERGDGPSLKKGQSVTWWPLVTCSRPGLPCPGDPLGPRAARTTRAPLPGVPGWGVTATTQPHSTRQAVCLGEVALRSLAPGKGPGSSPDKLALTTSQSWLGLSQCQVSGQTLLHPPERRAPGPG